MLDPHAPAQNSVQRRALALREELAERGVNLSDWARRRGYPVKLAHQILSGRRPCTRGQSHRIAVELGLKPGVVAEAAE